jgi:hypothetical protein
MKIIEGAAELSIMDGKSVDRQSVKITTLISNGYITKSPVCPKGGEYELKSEKSGFTVKCSKHGEMDKIYDDLYNPKKMK